MNVTRSAKTSIERKNTFFGKRSKGPGTRPSNGDESMVEAVKISPVRRERRITMWRVQFSFGRELGLRHITNSRSLRVARTVELRTTGTNNYRSEKAHESGAVHSVV